MSGTVIGTSYGLSAIAYLALLVITALSKAQSRQKWILLIVAGTSFCWALAIAFSPFVALPPWLLVLLEISRIASWLVFTADLLGLLRREAPELRLLQLLGVALPAAVASYVLIQPTLASYADIGGLPSGVALLMLLPVAGLLLLENLFRNADRDTRWATKHLCLAMGVIYAYDFFYFAEALLFGRPNPLLYSARGFISAMVVPLIALGVVRSRTWPVAIHLSRQVVFHSFALIGSGLYLLAMAAAGIYVRRMEAEWGAPLQIAFLIGAALILVFILGSGSLRARVKSFINRNFFSLKYDYRETWMHFIQTLSTGDANSNLQRRLLDAVCDLMESTGGALWIHSPEAASFVPGAKRNLGDELPAEPEGSSLANWLRQHRAVIELTEANDARRYPNLQVPDWLRTQRRAWLVIPLLHKDSLQGFIVLGEPRIVRPSDWEDYELLQAIGQQAASYIAEQQAANALSDRRQLEAFGKRFAFVAHDLKNIVGQLTLMLRNAERFKDDTRFRDDMMETVSHSVDRMRGLLQHLRSTTDDGTSAKSELISLGPLLEEIASAWRREHPQLSADLSPIGGSIRGSAERLRSVISHLLQNGLDAVGSDGRVTLRSRIAGGSATIEVEDDGPGMEADFVRQKLFRPFRSTKSTGFGIGAYQIREYVRSMNGQLEVLTAPGRGTTIQVIFPLIGSEPENASTLRLEAVAS